MTFPDTFPGRLLQTLAREGAAPRLTWYGGDGERAELSGRVFANWVTKATNMLVDEADAQPGASVVLHLPVHWRTLVWALAAWTAGARAVLPDGAATDVAGGEKPEVVVTSDPHGAPEADVVLAVALPALARSWDGPDLPAGVIDAAAEVLGHGDELGYVTEPAEEDPALAASGMTATFGELADWARGSLELGRPTRDTTDDVEPVRVLVAPSDLAGLLEQALAVWRAGGSLVLAAPGTDEELLARVADEERVDLRW